MVLHSSRLVFHGFMSVFIGFQGFRLVFHGYLWYKVGFMVPGCFFFMFFQGFRLFFMVPGPFYGFKRL